MLRRTPLVLLAVLAALGGGASAAGTASGRFSSQKLGAITLSHAAAYRVRDQRNARQVRTEILLSDVAIDAAPLAATLDPHSAAINADALDDRNYVLLWVGADGAVSMNATYSKTMTQYLTDTAGGLQASFTANTPSRVDGRVYTTAPLKTMDGTTYTIDVRFTVDVAATPAGTALPAGGGDAGKALVAFVAAAKAKNWIAIKAASSPEALKMFDASYNTPAENAANVADLVKAWLPLDKMKVTAGQLQGGGATATAILDVEGEKFPGTMTLSLVRMVKTGAVWQFDRAAMMGFVK